MTVIKPLTFKIATEPHEFEQIHHLNYCTFVEEIPQHASNTERRLVDRFHADNTYVICMNGEDLIGMIALRGERPFSLDQKLDDLDAYLPPGCTPCEARLLAVVPRFRKTSTFLGMLLRCVEIAEARGYDLVLISGTTRQLTFYEHLGFQPFGPLVGTPEASFQPMFLDWESFWRRVGKLIDQKRCAREVACFLPGPVAISNKVQKAFAGQAISHRSLHFTRSLEATKAKLCDQTGATDAAILSGSGTLANDVIAAQLSLAGEPGLILTNGEFGERLINHAESFRLDYHLHSEPWGEEFQFDVIERKLRSQPSIKWLWMVHCETSTGVLNDLARIKSICADLDIRLCVDCVSSIGAIAVDLTGVDLASCSSGKAIGSFAGLSIVLVGDGVTPAVGQLPRSLDLELHLRGTPFTMSSNLVAALQTALDSVGPNRYTLIDKASKRLRRRLRRAGLTILADDAIAAHYINTICLPKGVDSAKVAKDILRKESIQIAYASGYLQRRNWIQICLMGEFDSKAIDIVAKRLGEVVHSQRSG